MRFYQFESGVGDNTVSARFVVERGGYLRHIQHSFMVYDMAGGATGCQSALKTSSTLVLGVEDVVRTNVLSCLQVAGEITTSGANTLYANEWIDFADIVIPDQATFYIEHNALAGVIANWHTVIVLYVVDRFLPRAQGRRTGV